MTDEPQGQGWWQASDLKWYPPEHHPVTALPPPPILPTPPRPVTPAQPPAATTGPSGPRKVWFFLAGLVLLEIAVLIVANLLLSPMSAILLGLLVVVAIAIIGLRIPVRSGQSGARKVAFVTATVIVVAVAVPVASRRLHFAHVGNESSTGGGSPSAAFCADFLNLWDGPQGVSNAIVAVQEADAAKEYRAHGWTNTALLTAAKNAQKLAAEAPSDQLKTDFTNIAQTLSAHANLDLTFHGTGKEPTEVDGSTLTARCRIQGARGH
jgi:hypothetical protein